MSTRSRANSPLTHRPRRSSQSESRNRDPDQIPTSSSRDDNRTVHPMRRRSSSGRRRRRIDVRQVTHHPVTVEHKRRDLILSDVERLDWGDPVPTAQDGEGAGGRTRCGRWCGAAASTEPDSPTWVALCPPRQDAIWGVDILRTGLGEASVRHRHPMHRRSVHPVGLILPYVGNMVTYGEDQPEENPEPRGRSRSRSERRSVAPLR